MKELSFPIVSAESKSGASSSVMSPPPVTVIVELPATAKLLPAASVTVPPASRVSVEVITEFPRSMSSTSTICTAAAFTSIVLKSLAAESSVTSWPVAFRSVSPETRIVPLSVNAPPGTVMSRSPLTVALPRSRALTSCNVTSLPLTTVTGPPKSLLALSNVMLLAEPAVNEVSCPTVTTPLPVTAPEAVKLKSPPVEMPARSSPSVSPIEMSPDDVLVRSADPTVVSRSIPLTAVAVKPPATTSAAASSSSPMFNTDDSTTSAEPASIRPTSTPEAVSSIEMSSPTAPPDVAFTVVASISNGSADPLPTSPPAPPTVRLTVPAVMSGDPSPVPVIEPDVAVRSTVPPLTSREPPTKEIPLTAVNVPVPLVIASETAMDSPVTVRPARVRAVLKLTLSVPPSPSTVSAMVPGNCESTPSKLIVSLPSAAWITRVLVG